MSNKKYPVVYYQMKRMAEICRKNRDACTDKTYVDALIGALETQCEDIECAHLDDEYTGEMDDFVDVDGCADGEEVEAEDLDEIEDWAA